MPMCLVEKLASVNIFFALFSLCYLIETASFTILIGALQSIMKMFQISSQLCWTLSSAKEIGYVPAAIVVAFLGNRGNQTRWIGGCTLITFAYLLTALPHFLFGNSVNIAVNNTLRLRHVTEKDVILYKSIFKTRSDSSDSAPSWWPYGTSLSIGDDLLTIWRVPLQRRF